MIWDLKNDVSVFGFFRSFLSKTPKIRKKYYFIVSSMLNFIPTKYLKYPNQTRILPQIMFFKEQRKKPTKETHHFKYDHKLFS